MPLKKVTGDWKIVKLIFELLFILFFFYVIGIWNLFGAWCLELGISATSGGASTAGGGISAKGGGVWNGYC